MGELAKEILPVNIEDELRQSYLDGDRHWQTEQLFVKRFEQVRQSLQLDCSAFSETR
ncbi:MAG: hypothetical protein H5U33_06880, partial [Pseudomonas sp.]|nr:hypothetical protein [Pseudomonas sp.]